MEHYLYSQMYAIEKKHWWYCGRRHIIDSFLSKIMPCTPTKTSKVLEIGCGTGGNSEILNQYGETYGMEVFDEAIEYSKKNKFKHVKKGKLPSEIPFLKNYFDLIVALDVIEHVREDSQSLKALSEFLKPNGYLVITVPAYQFLWGKHDKERHHMRRYTKKKLINIIDTKQYIIEYISYFQFFLFPLLLIKRLFIDKLKIVKGKQVAQSDIVPPLWTNALFKQIFFFESKILRRFSFPYGSSIICLIRKKQ